METTTKGAGMSESQVTELKTAVTTSNGNILDTFVDYAPIFLGVAVVGFAIALGVRIFNKVRRGGR